jgi:hypothetical protein
MAIACAAIRTLLEVARQAGHSVAACDRHLPASSRTSILASE